MGKCSWIANAESVNPGEGHFSIGLGNMHNIKLKTLSQSVWLKLRHAGDTNAKREGQNNNNNNNNKSTKKNFSNTKKAKCTDLS